METISQAEHLVMRAIVAREHKKAQGERRAAIEAHKAATRPAPSNTSWSTKPDKKKKPGPALRQVAEVADASKRDWARRHPDKAAAERTIRKGRAELIERYGRKSNGTPETYEHASAIRTREGSLARLFSTGAIDADQLGAAIDIASVAERIGADVSVRTASLETRIDSGRRGDGTFYEALNQVRREMAYSRWRSQVRGIGAVLDMIVGDAVGFTVVARRYRMHNRRAKQLLIDALDLWPRIYGAVRKEIDEATLLAAHAGLLA